MPTIKPNALRPGDTIGVVAPAGPVDRERIDRAVDRLQQRGFRVKTYGDIYRSRGYLAGDDATRADELTDAFADPEPAAVWCARGGYGTTRLLDRIDFRVIRRHPKVFIGFSDITALHLAIGRQCGIVSFHGPNLQDGFGNRDDMPPANEAALWRAVMATEQPGNASGYEFDCAGPIDSALRTIRGGSATGRLTGGNLSVIAGLLGTPFELNTDGRILFFEEVNEQPYRVDRYLSQLWLAGKLQTAAGILLGDFSYDDDEPAESSAVVAALLDDYFSRLDVPVLAGFPAGHGRHNLTLPLEMQVELDATNRRVYVCDAPLTGGT